MRVSSEPRRTDCRWVGAKNSRASWLVGWVGGRRCVSCMAAQGAEASKRSWARTCRWSLGTWLPLPPTPALHYLPSSHSFLPSPCQAKAATLAQESAAAERLQKQLLQQERELARQAAQLAKDTAEVDVRSREAARLAAQVRVCVRGGTCVVISARRASQMLLHSTAAAVQSLRSQLAL